MALRIANKINRQFIKNVSRSMSTPKDVDIDAKQEAMQPKTIDNLSPMQYQVCRPRTTPVARFHKEAQNEADVAKQYVALQHLQPALLPEYYTPPLEIHSSICPEPLTEVDKQSNQIRRFEESKTYLNVTLPLKTPKLANPFPSPVKVMESLTISDQEKAEQMLTEAKAYKGMSANQTRHQHLTNEIHSFRSYSTSNDESISGDAEKPCPKFNRPATVKNTCKHFQLHHCDPPKTISCKRDKARLECKKKEAPYPSYSESCHEEPLEKPSECKICLSKREEHPTFKPPHKNFHSNCEHFSPKKEQCDEPTEREKKSICTDEGEKGKQKTKKKKPKRNCAPSLPPTKEFQNFYNDDNAKQEKKDCFQNIQTKLNGNMKPEHIAGLSDDITLWLHNLRSITTSSESNIPAKDMIFANSSEDKSCKKFPFKSENFPYEKKRTPAARKTQGKCPKKKPRRIIEDCSKDEDVNGSKKKCAQQQYRIVATKKKGHDETKCPKVELGICKDSDKEEDNSHKPRGNTWICPNDLLKKRNKRDPKKKCKASLPLSSQANIINSVTSECFKN